MVLDPFFANTPRGRRFAISAHPSGSARGGILFAPPFAEEMNKSRRMAALTARALAENGWHVLRFDLYGCGDSEGDFGAATWSGWLEEISFWEAWLRERTDGPIVIWGLRAGALLATTWLEQHNSNLPLLLWQPVNSGQQHLKQFLRLRAAAEMLDARKTQGVVTNLRAELASGSPVSVAGYTLDPDLATPLSSARLALPPGYTGATALCEILPSAESSPSPAIERLSNRWRESGVTVNPYNVAGPAFWRTVETETVPDLVSVTVAAADRIVL